VPTYQYACTTCGHQLEAVQSFTDAALTQCPECEGRLRKVFSAVGVVFKGSGFYRTDSRNGSSSESKASTESTSSTESKSSGEASTPAPATTAASSSSSSSSSASSSSSSSSGSSTASASAA
jgi:putative FmdB family regulatory protein